MAIPSIFIGAAAKATDWDSVFSDYSKENNLTYTMKILVSPRSKIDFIIFNVISKSNTHIKIFDKRFLAQKIFLFSKTQPSRTRSVNPLTRTLR